MGRLAAKQALVIGASTGIGREVCRVFAREGAAVAVGDYGHHDEKASLVEELRGWGRDAFPVEVNVLDEGQVKAAIEGALRRFGRIDILVNNAGISGYRGPLQGETVEGWDEVMAVNLRGVFLGMKHVLPHMLARRSGRIINTASQLAHKPGAFNAVYSASKAGVVALTASVAQDVALEGITVNAVCPGPTETPLFRQPGRERWSQAKIDALPMKRAAQPVEIAWAYVYLASDEASYCTGQSLSPNGGDVMW
jgi:NAD(P)-dependent dehydrogenase (short-subunit alcohol dehydrogenase family)